MEPNAIIPASVIRNVAFALSTDSTRPVLAAIRLEPSQSGGGVAVACDGHVLAVAHDVTMELVAPLSLVLAPNQWKRVTAKKVERVTVRVEDGQAVVTGVDKFSHVVAVEVGKVHSDTDYPYPNWRQVIPAETSATELPAIGIDAALLARFESWGRVRLSFTGEGRAIVIHKATDTSVLGLVMPWNMKDEHKPAWLPAWVQTPTQAPTTQIAAAA